MHLSNVCMECKNLPEEFESSDGQKAYWMVTMQDDYSPVQFTSDDQGNVKLNFIVGIDKDYVAQEGEVFMCINCFEKIHGEDND